MEISKINCAILLSLLLILIQEIKCNETDVHTLQEGLNPLENLILNGTVHQNGSQHNLNNQDEPSRIKRQFGYYPYEGFYRPPLPIFVGFGGIGTGIGFGRGFGFGRPGFGFGRPGFGGRGFGFGGRGFGGRGFGGRGFGGRGFGGFGGRGFGGFGGRGFGGFGGRRG